MRFSEYPLPARIAAYLLLLALAGSILLPFTWMILTSFKSLPDYVQNPFGLPAEWQLGNFANAWETGGFIRLYFNSLFITTVSVLGLLFMCSAAGYALAHFRFRGSNVVFLYFLAGMMIPPHVILIPSFRIMSSIGLVNTYFSVIFTYFAWVPFAIFFFRAYFASVPSELTEAARIDGASEAKIFFSVVLPLARPAFVTVGIVYFVWIFNDFLWPLVYLNSVEIRTVTLGMMNFQGQYSADTTLKTAALTLATLPPIIVFLIFRRQIQSGLIDGALKH
ncbi:carbohydrate ABC transporter permease [Bauldia sp.]|uniref:carbohydrate ABC transporter permease n=1 Tax=Bauldia sp. TaxID=2575872 RepID=UPI003BAA3C54